MTRSELLAHLADTEYAARRAREVVAGTPSVPTAIKSLRAAERTSAADVRIFGATVTLLERLSDEDD